MAETKGGNPDVFMYRQPCFHTEELTNLRAEVARLKGEVEKAVAAERERCARIVDNSKCFCMEPDEKGIINEPEGCYDAICYLNWSLKKIGEGVGG